MTVIMCFFALLVFLAGISVSEARGCDGQACDGSAGVLLLSHPTSRLARRAAQEEAVPVLLSVGTEVEMDEAAEAETEAVIEQRAEAELLELEVPQTADADVDSMEHVNSPASEIVSSGITVGYKFGVDGKTLNKFEQCFIEQQRTSQFRTPDNIENTMRDAFGQLNNDGTDRGDWAKCLPPPMYTLLTLEGFDEGDIESGAYEHKMKLATDFYTTLKWLHNEACAHIRLNIADPALQQRIQDEINNNVEMNVGQKIADAVGVVASQIVQQYRSLDPALNQGNADAIAALNASMGAVEAAIAVGLDADFVTIQDIGGMRSVRHKLDELMRNVQSMKEKLQDIDTFMASRPQYAARLSDEHGSRRRNKADGLLDAVQNVGLCGVKGSQPTDNGEVFEAHGFLTYTLGLGLSSGGDVLIETKKGMEKPEDVVSAASTALVSEILPGGTVTPDDHLPSYQDDLFAQGNLACGARQDGQWTIVTSDRDNVSNPVTTTQEEGYFCVWVLDDITVLPKNQRNGFSNTEFVAGSSSKMAEVLNGRQEFYDSFFPDEGEYKFYHCHYTPRNSGAVRVHSFQHQAERHYPGAVRQVCGCDWRKLGMLVSRCDCTLDGEANGGCRKAEMDMLNEHTQKDLWASGSSSASTPPSQVSLSHAALAHGQIVSYDYDDGDIEVRAYQDDTGRVRRTASNDAVCSVDDLGKPDANARSYERRILLKSPDNSTHRRRRRNPTHTFFTDFDMNGIVALPNCRQHSVDRGDCTFANYSEGEPEEFGIRDFQSKRWFSRQGLPYMAVPSGGVNTEFIKNGKPCDALALESDCVPADATGYAGEDLTKLLASFCDTPVSLYKVPAENGKAPKGFGKVEMPLPLLNGSNYRAYARANFGRSGNGTWLHCAGGRCNASHPAPAAQGKLDPRELVASSSPSGLFKGFSIMLGGAANMSEPSVVPVEWYDQKNRAFGVFNKHVAETYGTGDVDLGKHPEVIQQKVEAKIQSALKMVSAENGRQYGVTCSNGKYIYARQAADGSWPVVSTIREGYNRDGPRRDRGSFACRYLGVFCNNNNCNNNGDQDVPGPFTVYSYKNSYPYIA